MPETCGDVPAGVLVSAPANGTHFESAASPRPKPMMIVDGGAAAVSVASTTPACDTVNVWNALPAIGVMPVNVSVVRVTVGDVGADVVSLPVHALANRRAATTAMS